MYAGRFDRKNDNILNIDRAVTICVQRRRDLRDCCIFCFSQSILGFADRRCCFSKSFLCSFQSF